MPNQPRTPNRVIRIDEALWQAAKRAASDRGETITDVIRRALREYVANWPGGHS